MLVTVGLGIAAMGALLLWAAITGGSVTEQLKASIGR